MVVVVSVLVFSLSLLYSGVVIGLGLIIFMWMFELISLFDSVFVSEISVVLFVV